MSEKAPGSMQLRQSREHKIFDPRDASTGSGGAEVLDPTLAQRGNHWWLYLAGQAHGYGATDIFGAWLAPGAPLTATGWTLSRNSDGALEPVCGRERSASWDGPGGRHCPAYARGWDAAKKQWVERIYYAGAAENLWGPYTIGFLEWDGGRWVDQAEPAFVATADWEHGSVYEPNVIYHEGKWKLWYVAGSNFENYLVHGYAESDDGKTGWSRHEIFAPPEMKMFDFCVRPVGDHFEAIFARVWVGEGESPAETGLWWCRCDRPSARLSDWSEPMQIMTAQDRGWHAGPWRPSFDVDAADKNRRIVFFDGSYRTSDPGPFPFAFTLGCLEMELQPKETPEE